MGPTYTTTVDLSTSNGSITVANVSGATSQLTAVSFLSGPKGDKGDTGATGAAGPAGTGGDMYKSTYDINNDGMVDNSAALNGQSPSYYLSRTNHTGTQPVGTITGLATVATSGSYTDLSNKPTIGSGDMTKAVYDPTSKVADAFSQDNMVSGTTNKNYTATEQTKLAGIATGATANSSDATLLNRANHTGTQSADTLTDGTTNKAFLATERTKLSGIATAATANSSDATLLNRANHTGTQTASTISDFSTAADARITAQKGNASGIASLDGAGKVPVAQLPNSIMEYQGTWNANTNTPTLADGTGNTGDVYRVSVSGSQNLGSGSISFVVSDYAIYNGSTWEKADTTDAVSSVNGYTGTVTLAKADVGLGNVDNTSDVNKPISTATQTALNAKAATGANSDITSLTGLTTALPVSEGGSGRATHTSGSFLVGAGTSAVTYKTAPTGTVLGDSDTQTLTNKDLTSGTNTFPTFNQNTTGSAAKLTTARTIGGVSFDGTANISLTSGSGIQKGNGSGGLTAATADTDYAAAPAVSTAAAPGATPTITVGTAVYTYVEYTGMSAAITGITVSGSARRGDKLWISFTDNGTARAITFGTSFEASTIALPTTTVVSTRLDVGFIWNPATSKFRCVGVA